MRPRLMVILVSILFARSRRCKDGVPGGWWRRIARNRPHRVSKHMILWKPRLGCSARLRVVKRELRCRQDYLRKQDEDASLLRQDFKRRCASQYSLERSPRDQNPAAQGSVPCPRPLGNVDFRQRGGGQTSHRVHISIEITIATIRPRLLEVGSLRVA